MLDIGKFVIFITHYRTPPVEAHRPVTYFAVSNSVCFSGRPRPASHAHFRHWQRTVLVVVQISQTIQLCS